MRNAPAQRKNGLRTMEGLCLADRSRSGNALKRNGKEHRKNRLRDLAVAVPAVFLAVVAGLAVVDAAGRINGPATGDAIDGPQTVRIEPRSMTYRADGDFQNNNYPVDAPMIERVLARPFDIMKYQVTAGDYQRCIDEGGCQPAEARSEHAPEQEQPIVGVSYTDAQDYAVWLSRKTGERWSLPTDEQWAFAAGSRFADDQLGLTGDDGSNPALRWLRDYEQQSARKRSSEPAVRQSGAFGENELGVADIGGNVWNGPRHAIVGSMWMTRAGS